MRWLRNSRLEYERRACEGRLRRGGIAERCIEDEVAGRPLPELRGVIFQRRSRIDDGRQLVVLDLDQLRGIARKCERPRDHERDAFADVAHALDRERVLRDLDDRRARFCVKGRPLRIDVVRRDRRLPDRPMSIGDIVGRSKYTHDPGRGAGSLLPNRHDSRVCVRRADDDRVESVRHLNVVGVPAATKDEPPVFQTRDRFSNIATAHQRRLCPAAGKTLLLRGFSYNTPTRLSSTVLRSLRRSFVARCSRR